MIGMHYCIRTLGWGSNGIAGGMVLGYGLQCLLNLAMLARKVQFALSWKEMLLPVASSFFMLWVIRLCASVSAVGLLLAMVAGGVSYLLVLFATGAANSFFGMASAEENNGIDSNLTTFFSMELSGYLICDTIKKYVETEGSIWLNRW